jgi:hypothetical protein
MPDDGVIQIGTQVDLGPLKSGMGEFESVTKAALQQVALAQIAAKQASKDYLEVQKQFGAIAASNAQAAAIVTEEFGHQRAAVQELASAKKNLADIESAFKASLESETAAVAADTAAVEGLARAHSHTVSEVAAASGAIRVFEGNLPIRAVERFAVTTLGLGPILQAAFPVIGAIALTEMLVKVGAEMKKAYEEAEKLGETIKREFDDATAKVLLHNDELHVTNDRLENLIAKYSHQPENNLKLALDEAKVAADKLGDSLSSDIDKTLKLLEKNQTGFLSRAIFDQQDNKYVGEGAKRFQQQIADIRDAGLEAVRNATTETQAAAARAALNKNVADAYRGELQRVRDQENTARALQKEKETGSGSKASAFSRTDLSHEAAGIKDQTDLIETLKGYRQQLAANLDSIDLTNTNQKLETGANTAKAKFDNAKAGAETQRKAAREQMQEFEKEYSKLQSDHLLSVNEELNFWQRKLAALKEGSANFLKVQEKVGADYQRLFKEKVADQKGLDKENAAGAPGSNQFAQSLGAGDGSYVDSIFKAMRKDQEKDGRDTLAALKANFDEQYKAIDDGFKREEQRVKDHAQLGLISPKNEQGQLTQLHTADHTAQSANLQGRMDATDDPKAYEALLKQKQELDQKYALLHQADTTKMLLLDEQKYKQFFTTLNSGMQAAMNGWLQGTQTMSQAFGKMFDSILVSLFDFVEQWLLKKAEMWVLEQVFGDQARTQEAASTSATNVLEASSYAAVAGANALATTLDPAYAAAMFGVGMTFASLAAFEKGGIVGGSVGTAVPILAHAGERVLTAQQTQVFERTMSGSGGGGDTHIHISPQINALDGQSAAQAVKGLMPHLMREVSRTVRLSNL